MRINRSDNPDFSLIRKWLRTELYRSQEFNTWIFQVYIKQRIKFINSDKNKY